MVYTEAEDVYIIGYCSALHVTLRTATSVLPNACLTSFTSLSACCGVYADLANVVRCRGGEVYVSNVP